MRNRWMVAAVLAAGVLGLAACGSGGSSSPTTTGASVRTTHGLAGTAWDLGSYLGSGGTQVTASSAAKATIAFEDHAIVHGSTGCNSFNGTYTSRGSTLTIRPGALSLVACTDHALAAQESAILQYLPQVASYAVHGGFLILSDASGAALLNYTAGLNGLAGTAWTATGVNNGNGAVESTTATEKLTADFGPSGAFTGFGGCNNLSGTYSEPGGNALTITGLAATQMACDPATDALESQYTAALGSAATFEISGDHLTLRNAAGETQATFTLVG